MSADTWDDKLVGQRVTDVRNHSSGVTMDFESGEFTVRCTTVGVNEDPDVNPVALTGGREDESGNPNIVNPYKNLIFKGAEISGDSVEAGFENLRDTDVKITEARFTFYYQDSQGKGVDPGSTPDEALYGNESFEITGDIKPVNGDVIPEDSSESIKIEFDGGAAPNEGDWFIVFFRFTEQSGDELTLSGRYFIPPED
jgi:hypothetical protein